MESYIVEYAKKIRDNKDILEIDIDKCINELTKVESCLDNEYINNCQKFIEDLRFYHDFRNGQKTTSEDNNEFGRILKRCAKIAAKGCSGFN